MEVQPRGRRHQKVTSIYCVYSDIDERNLLEIASEISFKIACEGGNLIETIPMSKQEFEQSLGRSPFLWEVLEFGRPFFARLTGKSTLQTTCSA